MAITLLCVVALNNREVTTYTTAPEANTTQQVNASNAATRHGVVKQKVSLEATYSYVVLQLAACTNIVPLVFRKPVDYFTPAYPAIRPGVAFFKIFLSAAIQPNAP